MELYVKVSFYFGLIALIINSLTICIGKFPINRSVGVGEKFISTLISAAFTVWAGMLIL